VLDVFTNVLYEVLQVIGIIPNAVVLDTEKRIRDLSEEVERFDSIKINLIDFKNLVA
jgi:hypothetical protein